MDATTRRSSARPVSRYIPLTRRAVIATLCQTLGSEAEKACFAEIALRLQRHRGHGYRLLAEEIRRCYLPFSPDRDTMQIREFADEDRKAMGDRLAGLVRHLLQRANYVRLSNDDLTEMLSARSPYSLRIEVDLSEYDVMHVFVRDHYDETRTARRPEWAYLLKETYDVRIYRRLFVFLKLKSNEVRAAEIAEAEGISEDKALKTVEKRRRQLPPDTKSEHIYVKVFKDMPRHDLQILFPLRRVQFRPFDKIKFYATAGGGTVFGIVSTTGKVLAATNPLAAVGALIGFIGLLGRQISTFFNQRTRYMMELSQKLFFHNLANNRAALALLLDRAEEEDVKEDLIALFFNAGKTVPEGEIATRKRAICEMIAARYDVEVDFDFEDSLSRLVEDGLVTRENGVVTFPTLEECAERLEDILKSDDADDARHLCDHGAEPEMMEI
ncbi:DUF3754 domain-containing protein [Acuticoccus sp. M5D2P5]|uniref:DUF3754 domain-containing protein n=1 Tax=Acuticoccus kalidii TaxID=2910977 RepID=UPI001F25DD8B|nr:DUF3754 domain-containing protein [Acuticoccus kalidii]MCF3933548.1 DUF3754 domain-containing protein [Acuticoccus kalidii]